MCTGWGLLFKPWIIAGFELMISAKLHFVSDANMGALKTDKTMKIKIITLTLYQSLIFIN